ncbi:unnamed protein product, partial [Didymodactylos carnosus]
MWVPHTTGTV